MWWGMIVGILLQTLILIILTIRTDWDKEVTGLIDYQINFLSA